MFNRVLLAIDGNVLLRDIFLPTPTPTDPAPLALQQLWLVAMNGNLYKLQTSIGILLAVFAAGFWTLKFYQSLKEGDLRPSANDLVFPIILIMMFGDGGSNARLFTLAARDVMNNINISTNSVIDAEVSIRAANEAISNDILSQIVVGRLYRRCVASPDLNTIRTCAESTRIQVNAWTGGAAPAVQTGSNVQYEAQLKKFAQKMKERNEAKYKLVIDMARRNEVNAPVAEPNAAPNQSASQPNANATPGGQQKPTFSVLDPSYYDSVDSLDNIIKTIMSFRVGFIYIVEIMMIITALVGPIFLGLSLFPVGTKPFVTWGISFLSLGFCKICYTLISGLASIAFVYAGPDNIDATVVAVVLGLLAPVLAFSIASGSGISALTSVSQVAQNAGLKAGLNYYDSNK